MDNPLLAPWHTPFGLPPFAAINTAHFAGAFDQAFAEQNAAVTAICADTNAPDFSNTLAALERSENTLRRVAAVFFNLADAHTSEQLQELETQIVPQYAVHSGALYNNQALFTRVHAVADSRAILSAEQEHLLDEILIRFHRAGAALEPAARARVQALDEELASLTTRFNQNVMHDSNAFELVLETEDDLRGLPSFVREAALAEGEARDKPGKHVITISRSSITPFLSFSARRDLRERIYRAYTQCANNDNACNNQPVLAAIASRRAERARLLGYPTHAHYELANRMAGTPQRVYDLLGKIWAPAKRKVTAEAAALRECIAREGEEHELAAWDWPYYAEKEREHRYGLNPEQVKAYFLLENVIQGAFAVAGKLYGLTFTRRDKLPVYHPEVIAYEVTDAHGSHVGLFLTDFHMRPSKQSGAWMSELRGQSRFDGEVRPIILNCCNFSHATPCLLDMDEVRTLFHEFGHGLHGLLSQVQYPSLAGTNVKQDFVELPSQIMEHWAVQPEVMKSYARHYETDEPIPDDLIERLLAAGKFNEGFATTEYLAACYLDLAWHTLDGELAPPCAELEARAMREIGMLDLLDPRYRSSYFKHIFSGEAYSAGYYVYIWAAVLDTDGFDAFRENGIFDPATAAAFRTHVLERGGSADPMSLYIAFRGREPEVSALLRDRGLD